MGRRLVLWDPPRPVPGRTLAQSKEQLSVGTRRTKGRSIGRANWLTALAAVDEISVRPFSGRVQRCRHNVAARISPRERAELDDLADEIPACGERRRNAGQWEELPAVPAHHPAVHCAKEATPVLTPRRTWNPRGSSPRAGEHTWIYGRCKHPDAELVRPGPQHRAAAVLHGEHFRPAVVLDHRPAHAPPRCRPHLSCDGDTNAL